MAKHAASVANIDTDAAIQCGLRYVGAGAALIGVPAHDIAPHDLPALAGAWEAPLRDFCAVLLDSSLYVADTQAVLAGAPKKLTER